MNKLLAKLRQVWDKRDMYTFNIKDAPPYIIRKFNKHGSTKRGSRLFNTLVSERDMLRRKVKNFHDCLCDTQQAVEKLCPHNVNWLKTAVTKVRGQSMAAIVCGKCDKSFEEFRHKG